MRGEQVTPGLEMLFTAPDGRAIWTRVASVPIHDATGQVRAQASAISDIDALRRSAEALRRSEERLRDVLNSMAEGFALLGPDFTILDVNEETLRLDSRPRGEIVGRRYWDVFPESEYAPIGALFRQVMQDRSPAALEHDYVRPNGRALWLDMRAYPTPDGGLAIFWRDMTDRKRAEDALRESEQRYRTLFESMDQAYAVVEVLKDGAGRWTDFRFVEVNSAFMAHTSMPYPVGQTATELLGAPNPRWIQLYGEALDTGRPLRVEETEPTLERTFDLNIFSLDRARNRIAVLFTNITERRQWEERQKVLIGELQHRTRNLMGVVRSVAHTTARSCTDLPDFRERFTARLDALARVQGLLSRLTDTDRVTFDDLIRTELAAMTGTSDQVTLEGPLDVRLRSSTVQTLAMALHELATNAVKYGALRASGGRLAVRWSFDPAGEEGKPWLHIDWRESGVAMPPPGSPPAGSGQGRDLIERALPYQLSAKTTYELGADGVRCTIAIPVSSSNNGEAKAHV